MRASLRSVSHGPVFYFDVVDGVDHIFKWDAHFVPDRWYVKRVATGDFVTINSREWTEVVSACWAALTEDPYWGRLAQVRHAKSELNKALDAEYGSLHVRSK